MGETPHNPEAFAEAIARAKENLRLRESSSSHASPDPEFPAENLHAAPEGGDGDGEWGGGNVDLAALFASVGAQWEEERDSGGGEGGADAGGPVLSGADVLEMLTGVSEGYVIPVNTTETSQSSYEVTEEGVWHAYVKGKVYEREMIAFRPFVPVRRLKDDRGEVQYTIAWLTSAGEVAEFTRTANDLNSRTALNKAFPDVVVTSNHAAACVEYLAQCLRYNQAWLEERATVSATGLGWPEDMAVGEMDVEAFTSGPGRPRPVLDVKNTGAWLAGHESAGKLRDWTAAMAEAGDRPLVQAMVSASLAAPLLRVVGAKNFVVDLSGSTSGGKTIALSAAASVWGDPKKVMATWQDTRVAMEHKMSVLRGMPFFADETQLADEKAMEDVVYSITSGHSRARSRQDGSALIDAQRYETVLLATGEQPITATIKKGGISPRIVAMTGQPCRDAEQAAALSEAVKGAYGLAGEVFLTEMGRIGADVLEARWKAVKAVLEGGAANEVGKRRAASVAVMAVANEVAAQAGLVPLAGEELWTWLVDGGDSAVSDSEDDRPRGALRAVLGWAAANTSKFHGHVDAIGEPSQGWAGHWEESPKGSYVAFLPEVLEALMEKLGYDHARILSDWRDRGWTSAPKGRFTRKTVLNGKYPYQVRVIMLEDLRPDEGTEIVEVEPDARLAWVRGLG